MSTNKFQEFYSALQAKLKEKFPSIEIVQCVQQTNLGLNGHSNTYTFHAIDKETGERDCCELTIGQDGVAGWQRVISI